MSAGEGCRYRRNHLSQGLKARHLVPFRELERGLLAFRVRQQGKASLAYYPFRTT